MTVLTPEYARQILNAHPDLTGCSAEDKAILDLADRSRPPHHGSLLDLVNDVAARMTDVERYWVGKIVSENGEFGQVAGNAVCFGIDTPDHGGIARARLEDEAGDIHAAIVLAVRHGVLSGSRIARRSRAKQRKLSDPNQRDNLGRPLAPPLPPAQPADASLAIPVKEPTPPPVVEPPSTRTITVSDRVMDEITRLMERDTVELDTMLRRLLKIEPDAIITQDGTVGYEDPATGFILPEGFPIVRTWKGVTYRAKATCGGFESEAGVFYDSLHRLNLSLKVGRPENAWIEWAFVDASGRLRKLNAARPLPKPRVRERGRKARPEER